MSLLVCASFLLFVLSAVLPAAVTEPAKYSPGEKNDCSKCYSLLALVANVTDDDKNIFNLKNAFSPPDPIFVTVIYHYKDDFGNEIDTQIWFWSRSMPLIVHLYGLVLAPEVHLTLHQDYRNANEDYMRLLTQRVSFIY